MSLLTINRLTSSVGAEVLGVDADRLTSDELLGQAVLQALEDNGVLVFRGLRLDPETQVRFCRRLGEVDYSSDGHHPMPGIIRSRWTGRKFFGRHIDGCTRVGNECPQKATLMSAVQVAERGGETEFANSFAAYEELTEQENRRFGSLRVVHSLEASQRRITPNPRRRRCSAGGSGAPMSIRWYGLTVAAANRWSWAPRRTTSSAWTRTGAVRCEPNYFVAQPVPARSIGTAGRSATPSSGTTAACCTALHDMTRIRRGRCYVPPCSATNRSSKRDIST
jgi:Taurine catabolism dioxygenase TauD, TfdA family